MRSAWQVAHWALSNKYISNSYVSGSKLAVIVIKFPPQAGHTGVGIPLKSPMFNT